MCFLQNVQERLALVLSYIAKVGSAGEESGIQLQVEMVRNLS